MSTILLILLGLITLWWALRFLPAGADGHGTLPYLIAFVRFLWIPSAVILAIALIFRHWIVATLAALLIVAMLVFVSPWYRKRHNGSAKRDRPKQSSQDRKIQNNDDLYTVMTLNCRYGLADPQGIVDAVRSNDVSILALQELTQDLVTALDRVGLKALLPYCQLGRSHKSDNGGFNGIFSRTKPDAQAESTVNIAAADVPHCRINGVAVYSAHPKSPMRGCQDWSRGIVNLATLGRGVSDNPDISSTTKSGTAKQDGTSTVPGSDISQGDTVTQISGGTNDNAAQNDSSNVSSADVSPCETIVMGDLNSNLDHPSFRRLLNAGLQDAGLNVSHGVAASFPQWLPWPRLELDHILATSGLVASNVHTLTITGSDHLALLAELCNR
ncbi:endonuclease/exonuclease/phosphatase family protein [Bifidobacterium sp. ESL0745]|uniref:endonuclease/exonuclease/phosphatase family protein n=1 Tax=Bifidobacterium sp. ESL0745 TaxID=2983226 RepID=UPI0023F6C869|nr:endonuclease/exonuclease/phosphatase family protein [Bifidobacterium sp. ESL0745]MDF7666065.1 endonuclease/exonuclease/phosphatase family protein [Bifidobacterium sp. ESL0745]